MRTHLFFLVFAIAFSCAGLQAQSDLKYCGTDDRLHELYLENPALQEREGAMRNSGIEEGKRNRESNQLMSSVYIIPVVFHIIHDYGVENISDAQVFDAVSILNRDFRKMNADTSTIVAPFGPMAADCQIEFRLAQLDPNGNCTNGIDRIQSIETYVGDNGCKLNQWSRDMYLNIWVVQDIASGAAGYAYYPWTVDTSNVSRDGIVILSSNVGSIGTGNPATSRALTHEVGHYLGLAHVWGSTNNPGVACGDDGIGDTPDTKGWTSCNLTTNDVCNPGQPENVQNYMEYAYCQRMFTYGQAITMQYILNSTVSDRNHLWSPGNLAATGCLNVQPLCAPHADFDANRFMICEGGNLTLYDNTWSSGATSWNWSVTGPANFNYTTQNPLVTPLNVPGSYTVTLIATNAAGSDTLIRPDYFYVSPDAPAITQPYVESFESPYFMNLGYIIHNRANNLNYFQPTTLAAYTGTHALMLNNFGTTERGDVDEFITPSYYLSFQTGLQLQFKYAYATASLNSNNNLAKLRVYSTTNCGQLWGLRWARTDSLLPTVGLDTNIFIPVSPSMWSTVTINLPASCAAPNVRFKFEFTAPPDRAGNNLYIDDINILSTNVGIQENGDEAAFNVYPNPGDGSSVIAYVLDQSTDVKVDVYDLSGRLVCSRNFGEQATGTHVFPLSEIAPTLAEGTYVIQMHFGDFASSRKLFLFGKMGE